jgi:HEAT repeat protein
MKNDHQARHIKQLIEKLGNKNGLDRQKAREALVEIGKEAVGPLLKLLDQPKHIYRWEVMMTFKDMDESSLIPVFIKKLTDDESDIRWIAAEGLIQQGEKAIKPLLNLLIEKSDSIFVLAGTHHILNELHKYNKLPGNFPYYRIMPLLKTTSLAEELKITVHHTLKEMSKPRNDA